MGLSTSAHAFEEQETKKVEKEEETERIEVTGSRIKRVDLESVSPVVVVDIEEMRDKGFSTAYDALKDLTQASGTVQGAEWGSQGGFTPNAQTVSLRGLGTNQVLVLVNGRRMADYPRPYNGRSNFVNLSTIPFAAIKRIEIVTGGASAVYGSDAVAGVMNIITKNDVDETTVNFLHSTTTEGGGDQNRLQLVTGTTGDDYTLTAAFEYHKIDPIFASERDWLDSVDDGPGGRDYLDRAILDFDNRTFLYRDPGEQACIDSQSGFEHAYREGRGYFCGGDFTGLRTIRNERENLSAYINGTYQLNDDTELFMDILWADQTALVRGGNHWVGADVLYDTPDGSGNYGTLDFVYEQRQFSEKEFGWRDSDYEESSILVNFGAKGTMFEDYDWEFVVSRSENSSDSYRDWLKEEVVAPIFFGAMRTDGFPYYDGNSEIGLFDPITEDIKNRAVGTQVITSTSYSNNASFVVSGSAFELDAGDAYFAVVAEWNRQGYALIQDERTLNRDGQGWFGLTGTEGGGDRERYALGVELDIPVLENLDVKLAGRYDKYEDETSDIGGRFTPQIGLTYNPTEDILLRANWGKSFRAPDMHRVFAGPSGSFITAYDWIECEINYTGDEPFQPISDNCTSSSIQNFSEGSKTLEEEKGNNYGVGMVWDVTEELNFSVDWYRIELEQIVVSQSVQGLLDDAYDCKFGLEGRDPTDGFCQQIDSQIHRSDQDLTLGRIDYVDTAPINAAAHEIEGLDVSLGYNIDTEYGEFAAKLGWSHVLEMVYKATDEDSDENDRDKAWNDDARSIINGSISWTMDDMALVLSGRRIGSIPAWVQPTEYGLEDHPDYGKVDRLHPYITFNLTGSYQFNEDLSLTLQVVNLFNNKPPKDESHTSWPYYNGFQFGGASVGREVGMEVRYTF